MVQASANKSFSRKTSPVIERGGNLTIEWLENFIQSGGQFAPDARTQCGLNEAVLITRETKAEGLALFLNNGGVPHPNTPIYRNVTEAGLICSYVGSDAMAKIYNPAVDVKEKNDLPQGHHSPR